MSELFREFWWVFLIALVIGVIIAWWVFAANRKTTIQRSAEPAEEGGSKRNQALIDAAPASAAGIAAGTSDAADPTPAPASGGDDLTMIKGLGPKLAARLHGLGVTTFSQIAEWSEEDIDRVDAQLTEFQGRIRRDSWVEQARFLAEGDMDGFKGKFGAL